MKNTRILLSAAALALLIAGCSQDIDITGGSDTAATVTFRVGGSAGLVGRGNIATRTDGDTPEIQTDDEKRITSLYAVVFDDPGANAATESDVETVKGSEKFYRTIEVSLPSSGGSGIALPLSFTLEKEGFFQVCFVANPSQELKTLLGGLETGTSTVKDMKAKLEQNLLPDAMGSGPLMTSRFYAIATALGETEEIQTVTLTRAIARIDVLNAADYVSITKLTFHNRAVKTRLYNDNVVSLEDSQGLLESEGKEYTDGFPIVGNSETPSEYKEKIYTYEQLATEDQQDKRPYLTVEYKVDGEDKTLTHDIYFNEPMKAGEELKALQLRRNTLYRLKVTNADASVGFEITVLDWNKGEEIEIGKGDIIDGVPNSGTATSDDWKDAGEETVVVKIENAK